jgi:hypothetical protein
MRLSYFGVCATQAALVIVVGCSSGEQLDPEIEKLGRATGPVSPGAAAGGRMESMPPVRGEGAPATGGGGVFEGKVVETMQVPRYTYMLLDVGRGDPVWTAVTSTEVEVGQQVTVVESITMRDFKSRTLGRTFPIIVFGTRADAGAPAARTDGGLPPGHPAVGGMPPGHPPVDGEPAGHSPVEAQPTPSAD